MKAWQCSVRVLESGWIVTCGETRSKARYRVWKSAHEAGFNIKFGDIIVHRCRSLDCIADTMTNRCVLLAFAHREAREWRDRQTPPRIDQIQQDLDAGKIRQP